MLSRRALFSGVALVLTLVTIGRQSQAQVSPTSRENELVPPRFTIQVASFPSFAEARTFIARLQGDGERPLSSEVEIPGRGKWTRVLIGAFDSARAATAYARNLTGRGVIKEYLVKLAVEPVFARLDVFAARTASSLSEKGNPVIAGKNSLTGLAQPPLEPVSPRPIEMIHSVARETGSRQPSQLLPALENKRVLTNPAVNSIIAPGPDPVLLAFRLLCDTGPSERGGLWLTGDLEEGLARLRWIAGPRREDMVGVDGEGKVVLNTAKVAEAAGVIETSAAYAPLMVANFVSSDEGLLLLVQVTRGTKRYLLHLGKRVTTLDGDIVVGSSINLDNGFDSRINPARRNRQKLGNERPPAGFDCLIAINPSAHWANLNAGRTVPDGMVAFHELAEAYSKVEQGLEYLPSGSRPGAHNVALEREMKLRSATRGSDLVLTAGMNRVFKSEKDLSALRAQSALGR